MGFENITINYDCGVDFPLCWSTCHMARVDSFIRLVQVKDAENAVEHHVGPALYYALINWDHAIGLQTEAMQNNHELVYIYLVNKV